VRIGVDATAWDNRRGFGRFTRSAVTALVALDTDSEYLLYTLPRDAGAEPLPPRATVRTVARAGGARTDGASRRVTDVVRLARAVRADAPDVVLYPSPYTWFPPGARPTVLGVHDVIAREHPGLVLPRRRDRVLWQAKEGLALRRATRLFTVSEASRRALADRLGRPAARIGLVPEAPDPVFRPRQPGDADPPLRPLGVPDSEPFVLCAAGGISPHKNVEALVQAVAACASAPWLVIAGALGDEEYASSLAGVRRRIDELGLGERVVLPGYVPDETLAALYRAATLVVNPSLAEGFGLTAVEAAACGAPVVLSDIPAHRETLGAAAAFVDPRDTSAIAALLDELLGDAAWRARLAEACRAAVASLTWEEAGRRLRDLVHDAAGGAQDA
jgi:alpha-1,3-rhamnosyl/mannosyltransferase